MMMPAPFPFGLRMRTALLHAVWLASLGLVILLQPQPAAAASAGPRVIPAPAASSTSELAAWCARLAPRLLRVTREQCVASGLSATGAASARRVPILGRRFPANASTGRPLSILLVGGIHGDELTSTAVVFEWMQLLARAPRQPYQWMMVPLLNPDGMLARQPTRVNANGVDLNRNFPTPGWKDEAPAWWINKTRRDPRRYPGRAPLSEPESRWLHAEIERARPDLVVAVHAPYGLLDFDGPAPPPKRFGNLRIDRVGVFPGSLGNYGGLHKNVPVITIELAHARKMPSPDETRRIWEDMHRWIEKNLAHTVSAL